MISLPDLQRLADFVALAKQQGFDCKITATCSPPIAPPGQPVTPASERATARTVLWALNRLRGAPGQPNRELVRRFLFVRGWIAGNAENESWDLDHVPTSKSELAIIHGQIAAFEKTAKTPPQV